MDLSLIHTTIRTVLKDNDNALSLFEDTFREQLACAPIESLLRAEISPSLLLNSYKTALQKTSEFIQDSESSSLLASQLWNPILVTTLDTLAVISTQDTHLSSRSKMQNKTVQSKLQSTKPQRTVEKPDFNELNSQLTVYLQSYPSPYKSCPHIQCGVKGCKFCIGMFNEIKLTQCLDHRPCVPLGWFPHVGKPLWNTLRKKHDPQRPFVSTPQPVKASELPSRNSERSECGHPNCTNWACVPAHTNEIGSPEMYDPQSPDFASPSEMVMSPDTIDTDGFTLQVSRSPNRKRSPGSSSIQTIEQSGAKVRLTPKVRKDY